MLIKIFEIIGTIAFSLSGASVGINKKMDIFGVTMLGIITAVGGGIIRDNLIGVHPPVLFQEPMYIIISIIVSLIAFLPFIRKRINLDHKLLIILDSIGLGAFTIIGVSAGMNFNNIFLQVFLGLITGVGGGVIRDICSNDLPLIFIKHFYAIPSIIGALCCALIYGVNKEIAMVLGFLIIFILRLLAAKYKWHLTKA